MSAPLTPPELAEIKARVTPDRSQQLAFGDQLLNALERYAKARVSRRPNTVGFGDIEAAGLAVADLFRPLQQDAERLLAEVERLRAKMTDIICADCSTFERDVTMLECEGDHRE